MNNYNLLTKYAKKTFLALKNPYSTIDQVFPLAVDSILPLMDSTFYFMGVKNNDAIPRTILDRLTKKNFILHTLDKMSLGGRAVDMNIKNPITGNPMTGSSSGTAVNVFTHINDLGVGSDGGGSVLAPAMSLNLYGFISPLIEKDNMLKFCKSSTDGIKFTPSIGFITREFKVIEQAISAYFVLEDDMPKNVLINSSKVEKKNSIFTEKLNIFPGTIVSEEYPDIYGPREGLITFVKEKLESYDIICSYEGPVDVNGLGDSVFGNYDEDTKQAQERAAKGLIRVANMANASTLVIPSKNLGCGYVLLTSSDEKSISRLIAFAKKYFPEEKNALTESYFGNLDNYFKKGF